MEEQSKCFGILFLITICAFFVPILTDLISKKLKISIPVVVGEIVCGILIGKSCLGLVCDANTIPWLKFLYSFGFTYLMFLSGLEIDVNSILNMKKSNGEVFKRKIENPLVMSAVYFLLTVILAYGFSLLLTKTGYIKSAVMMTLIFSTTSVGVVVPTLKEKLLTKTDFGQTVLLSALVADFSTMLLLTAFVAFGSSEKISFNLLLGILIFTILIFIYKSHISKAFDWVGSKMLVIHPILERLEHSTSQIQVRGSIALMVLFMLASSLLGFEVILGAFLAGIVVNLLLGKVKSKALDLKLDAIGYGFFIPIFFISVGINLDMRVFFQNIQYIYLLLGILLAAFLVNIIPSALFMVRYGKRESIAAGCLLASRLSLIIAASTIAVKAGYISEAVNSTIVMVAIFTCTIAPIVFNKLLVTDSIENEEHQA